MHILSALLALVTPDPLFISVNPLEHDPIIELPAMIQGTCSDEGLTSTITAILTSDILNLTMILYPKNGAWQLPIEHLANNSYSMQLQLMNSLRYPIATTNIEFSIAVPEFISIVQPTYTSSSSGKTVVVKGYTSQAQTPITIFVNDVEYFTVTSTEIGTWNAVIKNLSHETQEIKAQLPNGTSATINI